MPRITFDPDTSRGAGGNGEWGISEETIQDKPDTGKGMGRGKSTDSGTGAPAAQQPQRPEAADVVRGGSMPTGPLRASTARYGISCKPSSSTVLLPGAIFHMPTCRTPSFRSACSANAAWWYPDSVRYTCAKPFSTAPLSGLDFGQCVKAGFGVSFVRSRLDNCSFYELKMPGTRFDDCELTGCLFAESDLTGASFDGCKLPATEFDRCRLEGPISARRRSSRSIRAAICCGGRSFPLQPRGVACRVRD